MALKVIDRAMQVHGAEGISQDQPLAYMYANLRTLRYADVSELDLRMAEYHDCAEKRTYANV
jgi:alkylation response protein AidB-like acyl-CoA dehydrogenase